MWFPRGVQQCGTQAYGEAPQQHSIRPHEEPGLQNKQPAAKGADSAELGTGNAEKCTTLC